MKKQHFILTVVVAALIAATVSFAQGSKSPESESKYTVIENNYLEGLKSDVLGLRISCAYFLGELKSQKAVIPLMNMLNTETHEGARIMAAWSLVKIGDPRGVYLVKQHSEQCDCSSVQCMCEYLYNHFVMAQEGKTTLE